MRTFRTPAMDADDEDERQALIESVVERWAREGYTADGYAMDEAESAIHEDGRNDWGES